MTGPNGARPVAGSAGAAALALADPQVLFAIERLGAENLPDTRFVRQVAERRVEFDAIVELLLASRTPGLSADDAEPLARAIAAGCLGEQHLWRDLELPNRAVLRGLFEAYFEPFAADNVMDMRWKKYLYRKLCRWGGFHTCQAPSCGVCSSYQECFGPGA